MRRLMLTVTLTLAAMMTLAMPVLAQEALGSGLTRIFSHEFDTTAIVFVLGAIGTVALALSKFLPGWATKLNVVMVIAAGIASGIEALGPKATAVAILIAAFGAWKGYTRSESRAAGTPEAMERIAELRG